MLLGVHGAACADILLRVLSLETRTSLLIDRQERHLHNDLAISLLLEALCQAFCSAQVFKQVEHRVACFPHVVLLDSAELGDDTGMRRRHRLVGKKHVTRVHTREHAHACSNTDITARHHCQAGCRTGVEQIVSEARVVKASAGDMTHEPS